MTTSTGCWVCGEERLSLVRPSTLDAPLAGEQFRITDRRYGQTAAIYRCNRCGFLQCSDLTDERQFYEEMEDEGYEETRPVRALQMRKLLSMSTIPPPQAATRLLDIGAGSGILVEEAQRLGYEAEGVEPSKWLWRRANERGLPVHLGTVDDVSLRPGFDVVMLVDVIEHVSDPLGLLRSVRRLLGPDGVAIIVTPDVRSWPARLLGWRWWHFRIAHIGYFSRATLGRVLESAGLAATEWRRPTWYFHLDYLLERTLSYLPGSPRLPLPEALARLTVPLNLHDSLIAIVRRAS